MSTHVDGPPPSVSDPDDGEPDRRPAGLDDSSQWVRAEIKRRMAANRSTRGRHARRVDAAPVGGANRALESPPASAPIGGSQTVPLPPPGFVAAGDLPENYVPRHSVQTPGPAAEPAAPISGPIPIVRPEPGDSAHGLASAEPRRPPVGGPSLPPTGVQLPVRKKRSGPGTPLQSGGGVDTGPWSRPASIVPSESVQRLGAPPGVLGGAHSPPSWGVPASPPRGFAPAQPDPVPDEGRPTVDEARTAREIDEHGAVRDVAEVAEVAADPGDDEPTPAVAVDPVGPVDDAAADEPPTNQPETHRDDKPSVADDPAEATTAVLPVVDSAATDGAVPPPARLVGIPVQRASGQARTVTPRTVTPRNIPVVDTAPPEPGSTRVRVVLSERKGVARPVRTIKEVQEGTAVGELLRRDLIRSQLMVTLRFGALAMLVLGTLPAILTLLPAVGQFHVLGLRVPWLLLGVLMYPFLVGVAWRYSRVADSVEQDFADHVQD